MNDEAPNRCPLTLAEDRTGRVAGIVLPVGAFLFFMLPGVLGPYGIFIDELYYAACAGRLDWGFVDHPPLAPAVLAISEWILGDTIWAFRIPPASAGALAVAMAMAVAKRLGAETWGRVVTGSAVMSASILQILFGFYSMNAFEVMTWIALVWTLIEIEGGRPRLWLVFGALAGLGFESKHTVIVLIAALAVGLLATPMRRHWRSPWLWAGAALALALAAPNLIWQVAHGWPSFEFYANANRYKNVPTPAWEVALMQTLTMNPGTLPLWLTGAGFFLLARRGRPWRFVGIAFVLLFVLLVLAGSSRPDRIAGIYPVLMAAGAAVLDRWSATAPKRRWLRWAVPAWVGLNGLALLPVGTPILPPAAEARYTAALGVVPQIERGAGKTAPLPQWFADRLGWDGLVVDVDRALEDLGDAGTEAVVFAPSYGQAGALERAWRRGTKEQTGRPVYSGHNNYFLWGPPVEPVTIALVLGEDEARLRTLFEEVSLVGWHRCDFCMAWRDDMPIWRVASPRQPLAEIWPSLKHFG